MRLLTLPLTLARLPFRIAGAALSAAAGLLRDGDERSPSVVVSPQPRFVREPPRARPRPVVENGGTPPPVAAPAPSAAAQPPAAAERPAPPEPAHVGEEPVLVAETAERGAEEGAGAEVRVDEPWPGYNRMTAADIRERLRAEPLAVAVAVRLYEAGGKGRSSVLEAAAQRTRA
jgi:hypothetical protein